MLEGEKAAIPNHRGHGVSKRETKQEDGTWPWQRGFFGIKEGARA